MRRGGKVAWALVVFGLWASCGDSHPTLDAGSPCANPTLVSLPSCPVEDPFSDEACGALDDRVSAGRVSTTDARASAVVSPMEAEVVPSGAPYAFRWSEPMVRRSAPRRPWTLGGELRRWVVLVPEAEAHCAPFNGRGYELSFKAGGRVVFRRQQSGTSWTPTMDQWTRLRGLLGTDTVELTVYNALFSNSQIASGNGPFVGSAPRRFRVAP
ncbi:MAG: hypothetical protein HY909_00095 [Deltaproteobacteria bacterium]|nr:hypothetical protein [Deltaproteobacteria bacterium]